MRFAHLPLIALLPLLAACSGEPDEAAIRQGLETMHTEWAEQARNQARLYDQARRHAEALTREDAAAAEARAAQPEIRPNLGFEAQFDLKIAQVRKLDCRPPGDERLGYLCVAEVRASIAGQPAVKRKIEGRFIAGPTRWLARDVQTLDVN
jgi:hypothetical protein